jgi:hypothetical protein
VAKPGDIVVHPTFGAAIAAPNDMSGCARCAFMKPHFLGVCGLEQHGVDIENEFNCVRIVWWKDTPENRMALITRKLRGENPN